MRVVVTGATSMIGAALINKCIENNVEVMAFVRKNTSRINRLPKSDLLHIEEVELDELAEYTSESKYDVFYHLGWSHTAKGERDNACLQAENIFTSLEAVKLAKRLGCDKFVGAGSQAEYGVVDGPISSDTIPNPLTTYGVSKYSANKLCEKLCSELDMKFVWGRIFSVYGINDNEGTMIKYALEQYQNNEVAYFSAGVQMWNYLYEEDAGQIFYLFGKCDIEDGVYCVASDKSMRLRDYIEILTNVYGNDAKCVFASLTEENKNPGIEADISKTINAINFVPKITFAEGIKKVIDTIG